MILILSLLACGADHTKDKAEAVVAEAKIIEKKAAPAGARTLKVQPGARLRAVGAKLIGSHPIDFKDFEGTVVLDGDNVTQVTFKVEMKTLASDDDRLTSHLLNADFFDVEQFPLATFESTALSKGGQKTSHTVTGNLSLHGSTKSVTFPANIVMKDGMVEASADFSVNRQDFGMVYKGKADNLIQDKVALEIRFTAR